VKGRSSKDRSRFYVLCSKDRFGELICQTTQAESSELLVVGLAAYGTGKLVTAETAWRQAADKGNSEVAPRAAFNLGVL
jgi:hypothetical protein